MAAPRQIRIWVRNPAGRRLYSRSSPMRPPHTTASSIRSVVDSTVTSRTPSKNRQQSPHLPQISSMV